MVSNRMTEGVGKKIVDALKKQTDVDFVQTQEDRFLTDEQPISINEPMPTFDFIQDSEPAPKEEAMHYQENSEDITRPTFTMESINKEAIQSHTTQVFNKTHDAFSSDFEDVDLPANVEVLRQLITKLPSNVSKHTGAQIIKQTMEALGISIKSVLQEAQQAQENLNASAKECQNNIAEYRRQINALENQTQKLHKQYSMLNDIISLFIQAGN